METIFGSLTLIFSLATAFVGFPSQIAKNHREKRCGLSLPMLILPLAVFVSRAVYAVNISSWYIAIPDFFGIVLITILLWQHIAYRSEK